MLKENPVMSKLHSFNQKLDAKQVEIDENVRRQAEGDKDAGGEFLKLVEQRSVTMKAMEATVKLYKKPEKTALSENH
jgi:hypothetical protein